MAKRESKIDNETLAKAILIAESAGVSHKERLDAVDTIWMWANQEDDDGSVKT